MPNSFENSEDRIVSLLPRIHIMLFSENALNDMQALNYLFDAWSTYLPNHMPEKFGHGEILKNAFRLDRVSELAYFNLSLSLERRAPFVSASLSENTDSSDYRHSTFSLELDCTGLNESRLISFVKHCAKALQVPFALVHRITKYDLKTSISNVHWPKGQPEPLVTLYQPYFDKCIPHLYWLNIFGKPFVELLGRDQLSTCPIHSVDWLDDNLVALQMTPSVIQSADDPLTLEIARILARQHLNRVYIREPELPDSYPYKLAKLF